MTTPPEPDPTYLLAPREAQESVAEWLLPRLVNDIDRRSRIGTDRYELLGMAPLIRQALLDEFSTVAWASRRLKLRSPTFEFTAYEPPTAQEGIVQILGLDQGQFHHPTSKGKLATLLRQPIGQYEGRPVTVKALVAAYSHVLGGVHGGRPSNDFEDALLRTIGTFPDSGSVIGAEALRSLGRVVVRGLKPLITTITAAEPRKAPTQPGG